MLDLKNLMVIIDTKQDQHPALQRALQLATVFDVELKLIACDFTPYLVEGYFLDSFRLEPFKQEHVTRISELLEKITKPIQKQGIRVEYSVLWGNPPYEEMVREAVRTEPDMVLHSTRYHSKYARMLLSNEDWHLIRSCPTPLLLAKDKQWQSKGSVIAAVDPTHIRDKPPGLDHDILQSAKYLSDHSASTLHVFHACNPTGLRGKALKAAHQKHKDKLDYLLQSFPIPAQQVHFKEQSVEKALPQLVEDLNANVVVMGAISRGRINDAFIGNTAENTLDSLECDVLVVKPYGFSTPVNNLPARNKTWL